MEKITVNELRAMLTKLENYCPDGPNDCSVHAWAIEELYINIIDKSFDRLDHNARIVLYMFFKRKINLGLSLKDNQMVYYYTVCHNYLMSEETMESTVSEFITLHDIILG